MEPNGTKVENFPKAQRGSRPPPDPTTTTSSSASMAVSPTEVPKTAVEPTQQHQQQQKPMLPTGWSSAISHQQDGGGRAVYYYEQSSGRTSWNFPNELLPQASTSAATIPPPPPLPPPSSPSSWSRPMRMIRKNKNRNSTSAGLLNDDDRRPDEHACLAIVACVVFIPLGMISLIYSLKVDSAWAKGQTRQSFKYSRRAQMFGQLACILGGIFWIYWIFFSGPGGAPMEFHWPAEWFGV